jgi:hypothetical protein
LILDVRGKRLKLALSLKAFSESETPNVGKALLNAAEGIVDIEEYRKYMHDRILGRATEPIDSYKTLIKNLQGDIKNRELAFTKEQKKQIDFDKMSMKNSNDKNKIVKNKNLFSQKVNWN